MLSGNSSSLVLFRSICLLEFLGDLGLFLSCLLSNLGLCRLIVLLVNFGLECLLLGFVLLSLIELLLEAGDFSIVDSLVALQSLSGFFL